MDRPIGFWLKLVDRLIDEAFESTLDEHGITRLQWQILNVVDQGGATPESLDAAVSPFLSTQESTAAAVEELVESDWVETIGSAFLLTEKGELALSRLSVVVAGIRSSLAGGIPPEDHATTTRTLQRMAENLGWAGGTEGSDRT